MINILVAFYEKGNLEVARALRAIAIVENNVLIKASNENEIDNVNLNYERVKSIKNKGVLVANMELIIEVCNALNIQSDSFFDEISYELFKNEANLCGIERIKTLPLTLAERGLYSFLMNDSVVLEFLSVDIIAEYFNESKELIDNAISQLISFELLAIFYDTTQNSFIWITNPTKEDLAFVRMQSKEFTSAETDETVLNSHVEATHTEDLTTLNDTGE
jgi:hypothetical protein